MKHHRLVLPAAMTAVAALFILMVVSHSGAALPADQINQPAATVYTTYLPLVMRNWPYVEEPALAWATSENAVLLRWRWPKCQGEATFNVSRNRHIIAHDIGKITDEAAAIQVLGSDWNWIRERYTDVTTIAGLHAKLAANPLLADQLANTHYRIALVLGWGFMDETAIPGATYDYRVTKVQNGQSDVAGPVSILAGQITPLDAPTGLRTVEVISPALKTSSDWAAAQQNRKADRRIYLTWDLPGGRGTRNWPTAWNASYDVFRSTAASGPFTRINVQGSEDRPILPMPGTDPAPSITTPTYIDYDHFYEDSDPALLYTTTYYYRAAPRDLLGQPRRWPTDSLQFSDIVTAVPQDTLPPPVPENLTTTPMTTHIAITWTPITGEAVTYRLYRSTSTTASVKIAECGADTNLCWTPIVTTAQTTVNDADVATDVEYWYRVRAMDGAGNLSAWSEPVRGILHDRTPPCAPNVIREDTQIIVESCAADVSHHLLYCSFDGGPEMMIAQLPTSTGGMHFDLRQYYTPPYPLVSACRVQSVDHHGNRSAFVAAQAISLCPTTPITPMTPIIRDIGTQSGGTHGWTAEVEWAIEPSPMIQEFRIYRFAEGKTVTMTAQAGARRFYDSQVEPNVTYSYTVSAVQKAHTCGSGSVPEKEVRSQARLYRVMPPLPCCGRAAGTLAWDSSSNFQPGQGTWLHWYNRARPSQEQMLVIVYRSSRSEGDYVALTPPFVSTQYLDTDALHGNYWYVIVMLDFATGEIVGKTVPWSPSTGAPVARPSTALPTEKNAPAPAAPSVPKPLIRSVSAPMDSWTAHDISDTTISGGQPDQNFGDQPTMVVGFQSDTMNPGTASLVGFDVSGLPYGARIDAATFDAYLNTTSGAESIEVSILRVTSAWQEMSVTWNTIPSTDGIYDTRAISTTPGWYRWDVTTLVREWHSSESPNYGLLLASGPPNHSRSFLTREGDQTYRPYLYVTYTPPPSQLFFGDGFVVQVTAYDPGSTLDDLSGSGLLQVGGGPAPTLVYNVQFSHINAASDGTVISGQVTVPIGSPIPVNIPSGLSYQVESLVISPEGGRGDIGIDLPADTILHYNGAPYDPLTLNNATIHPNLTFTVSRNWVSVCHPDSSQKPIYYFEMTPLPLRIAPTGPLTFTSESVTLSSVCTQYDERYAGGTRPAYPNGNANDGFLQNVVYTSTGPMHIDSTGLAGGLAASQPITYVTAMPLGFALTARQGISLTLAQNKIADGGMSDVALYLRYYPSHVTSLDGIALPPPSKDYLGLATRLQIGPGGSVYGTVRTSLYTLFEMYPIVWAEGNLVLTNWLNTLYLPPVQTVGLPEEDAAASFTGDARVQSGLNILTEPGGSVNSFEWRQCGEQPPITFPDGVQADMYVRRGGVSDRITATLSLSTGLATHLYGYTTTLKTFRATFCDNLTWRTDIAGDLYLPWPSDVTLPLTDMQLDPKACVRASAVNDAPLTLGYWQTVLHPQAATFKDTASPPPTTTVWIQGKLDVPHLALSRTLPVETPIPLEISFKPDGTFYDMNLVYDKAHYGFDSFDLLVSKVRLSDWLAPNNIEPPRWAPEATLDAPPACCTNTSHGFVEIKGNLIAPYFGTLQGRTANSRPDLQVLAWNKYVGFTERPKAARTWDLVVAEHHYDFDLVYAHHHTLHSGVFVGFRQDSFLVVDFDSGVVISPTQTAIHLGLSSGSAILRALAEITLTPLPSTLDDALKNKMKQDWVPRMWSDTTLGGQYVDFLKSVWDWKNGQYHYGDTTYVIDAWGDAPHDFPDDPTGGKTTAPLDTWVHMKQMRGAVEFQEVKSGNAVVDWNVERMRLSMYLLIRKSQSYRLCEVKRQSFEVTRDGDFIMTGKNVTVYLSNYPAVNGDTQILIRPSLSDPRLEGNVVLYNFDTGAVQFKRAGAAVGIGFHVYYIGAQADGSFQGANLGGAFLIGSIDPASPVLRSAGFDDLLNKLGETHAGTLTGGYVRVYGDYPLYNAGCLFRVSVGGEVSAWFFAANMENPPPGQEGIYGGRLRGYVFGTALCIISARGDVTLELYKPGKNDVSTYSFEGTLWVAGGIGFCEPNEWTSWNDRWWNDSWCYTCGAMVSVDYNVGQPNDWDWSYDMECE